MIEFDIQQGSLIQTAEGIAPTHKITVRQGAATSVYWYLQQLRSNTPFAPGLDDKLVTHMHSRAQTLPVGDFLYLSLGHGRDYHLHRLGRDKFTLKALA